MTKLYIHSVLFWALLATPTLVFAQKAWPIIRANSETVNIRDGSIYKAGAWTIVPAAKPDVYETSCNNERVTFYTDVDSISFLVGPKAVIDFYILLNGKDTAWTQIRHRPSYLDVLQQAHAYDPSDRRPVPTFTYQSPDNPNLVALRKGFRLDSIAGTGNDVSKVLNLLHWVHDLVPHDGQHENPEVKNAMSMIEVCKKDKRGLNCRGLATVLNECYLSLGFKSRFITCMPKDSLDNDCHVINIVWINDLNKWVWVDPTNDAYVMNEMGELLSVEEVRERLVNGKMLILNPDANWNHKESTTKSQYLYQYMAKNLYRIECPVSSEYDTETWEKGKTATYVELLPLDAYPMPQYRSATNKKSGVTFVNYKTHNPNLFWAKP
jgi:Transglutaminase-like superfamily